jgi:hypothetical protein
MREFAGNPAQQCVKFEEIIRASLTSKSPRQRKKWRQPKETALSAFVDLVGNRPITSLTRADALRLRSHWQDRVVAGEVQIGTANKSIGHVSTMFRAINESKQRTSLQFSSAYASGVARTISVSPSPPHLCSNGFWQRECLMTSMPKLDGPSI